LRARAQLKTPEEIALLRKLSRIADSSITDAFASVGVGKQRTRHRGRDDARRLHARRGSIPSYDRRNRRAFRVSECRPTERKLASQDVCRVEDILHA